MATGGKIVFTGIKEALTFYRKSIYERFANLSRLNVFNFLDIYDN